MSHSFYVQLERWPPTSDYPACLDLPDLVCTEAFPDPPWPEGNYHIYQHGVSTRTVELGWYPTVLQVRLMSCSCAAEYEVAFRTIEYAANNGSGKVSSEDADEEFPVSFLRDKYDQAWVDDQVAGGPRMIAAMVNQEEGFITIPRPAGASADDAGPQVVTIHGPVRLAHIGPRVIGELTRGPHEEFTQRFVDFLRRVQYPDAVFFEASTMVAKHQGKEFTFAVWNPEVSYLFPAVDKFALHTEPDEDPIVVPSEALAKLAGDRLTWLDEKQALVAETPKGEWGELLDRARSYLLATSSLLSADAATLEKLRDMVAGGGREVKTKWWQFWK